MLKNKRYLIMVVVLLLALATIACAGGIGGTPTVDTDLGTGATLTITNSGSADICYVYISPITDDFWGEDELGNNQTISTGNSVIFNLAPNTYDVRVDDCDGSYSEEYGYAVSGDTVWAVAVP